MELGKDAGILLLFSSYFITREYDIDIELSNKHVRWYLQIALVYTCYA